MGNSTFFKSCAVAFMALAGGLNVHSQSWVETPLTDLTEDDVFAIVDITTSKAMPNSYGTGTP